ncbi:MAG: NlpC/P60 family protein [Paracoccaceae bacterium]
MDRRLTPFSGRVAHASLAGRIDAPLTQGTPAAIATPLADLLARPHGPRDRQLIQGEAVTVIDRDQDQAFVMAAKDGYCGWLDQAALGPAFTASHRVSSPKTHLYSAPKAQAPDPRPLYMGARVQVTGTQGKWATTPQGHIPACHLAPLDQPAADPVAVAELFLHAPYLWGGNSVGGIDCSGLAQIALHAAGIACPGDSDLQQQVGQPLAETAALQRGDLIFWKGHVALLTGPDRIIHANGATMSVACEDLATAIARIQAQGEGPPVARRRPLLPA